ncbi:hypothetical protein D3C81_1719550 [compost metagenome]
MRFVGRVEPIFIQQRADLGLYNLLEPFLRVSRFQSMRRCHIAVANPELLTETGIRRNLIVQREKSLLDILHQDWINSTLFDHPVPPHEP